MTKSIKKSEFASEKDSAKGTVSAGQSFLDCQFSNRSVNSKSSGHRIACQFANDRNFYLSVSNQNELVIESTPAPALMCLLSSIGANSTLPIVDSVRDAACMTRFNWQIFLPKVYANMHVSYYSGGLIDCANNIVKLIIEPQWLRKELSEFLNRIICMAQAEEAQTAAKANENCKDWTKTACIAVDELVLLLKTSQVSTSSRCTTHLFAFKDCLPELRVNPVMSALGRPAKQAVEFSTENFVESIYSEFDTMLASETISYVVGFAQVNLAVRRFFSAYMATKSSRITIVSHPIMATIATCTAALNSCQRRLEKFVIKHEQIRQRSTVKASI